MKKLLTFFILLLASQNIQAQQSEATLSNSGNDNDYWETELFGDGPNGHVHAIAIKGDNIFVGGLFNAADPALASVDIYVNSELALEGVTYQSATFRRLDSSLHENKKAPASDGSGLFLCKILLINYRKTNR